MTESKEIVPHQRLIMQTVFNQVLHSNLMPAGASVLTVEFKVNLLAPAKGESFLARGMVVKPGKTITVCSGEVFAVGSDEPKLVATMTATMMTLQGRVGVTEG
ncbi:MAG TPA: PaaI family thioesterase [Syntrophomonas sp.]|nr:PaaI family thioesterase [Syntrophomonas sp.]